MAEAKTIVAISAETHRELKQRALDLNIKLNQLMERYLRAGLGIKSAEPVQHEGYGGYRGNAFTGIDVVDPEGEPEK